MKPAFALDLTRDAIALLHRTPKGWLSIGDVAFDAPDLAKALDYLRKTALGLSPLGMACKVILPNSQILYTEVEAPGPSRNDKRRQIAAALEGRTPYAVEDLVFDWSGKGATVKVAVIARETLAEAEGFAVTHRLNPVSFVAIPDDGAFVGEPFFGPTAAAETLLAPGEAVDRDRDPVAILLREQPTANPAPSPVAEEAAVAGTGAEDDNAPLPGLEEALNAALADEVPKAGVQHDAVVDARPDPQPDPQPDGKADRRTDEAATSAPGDLIAEERLPFPDPVPNPVLDEAGPSASADPAVAPVPEPVPEAPAPRAPLPEAEEAPFAHVTDTSAFLDDDDMAPRSRGADVTSTAVPPIDDDVPAAPAPAAMAAFASRRSATAAETGPLGGAIRPAVGAAPQDSLKARLGGQPVPRPVLPPKATGAGPVTAPTLQGMRPKAKVKPGISGSAGASATDPTNPKPLSRPGGTFGTTAAPRNRSGVVFMVLVAVLLLFLALIAGWSSFFLARNGQTETETGMIPAGEDGVPDINDEMLADLQDPEGMTDPLPEAGSSLTGGAASLATESQPVNIGGDEGLADAEVSPDVPAEVASEVPAEELAEVPPETAALAPAEALGMDDGAAALTLGVADDAMPLPRGDVAGRSGETAADVSAAPEPELAPKAEPAPGTTVTTELASAQAPAEDQDEIFLSAMDAPPPAFDALALPVPKAVADAAPGSAMPPPAFGTVYQFDASGLLKPTPEGILSPEGVMLIAGKPPLLPPSRSDAASAAALAAAPKPAADLPPAETDPAASDPAGASLVAAGALGGETAVDQAPDATELVPSDPAMAGFRPKPRPEGLAPETGGDDAALPGDTTAGFAGLRPLARPESILVAASASRPAGAGATDLGAQGASLAAQAEADLAAAAALEAADPSIVAISKRPQGRPRDLSRAVEAAVAAAVRAPEPEADPAPEPEVVAAAAPAADLKPEELDEVDEPETAKSAPSIPTKASVAKQATFKNAINLSKVNLIGTYGTDSKRYALVRQSNGRYKKVKVGDKIDGGTVKAITSTEVRYQKGGKLLTLKMPKA